MKILINLASHLLSEALRDFLGRESGKYQLAVAADLKQMEDFQPGTIIVDSHSLAGPSFAQWPEAKIVLIDTGLEEEQLVRLLLNHSIDGVISTDTSPQLFRKALDSIHAGQVWIDNAKIKALLNHIESVVKSPREESISKKEQQIIVLVSQGRKNKEIAARLCISEQTVKAHISRIFRKCDVSSRSQLVPLAMKYRLPNIV